MDHRWIILFSIAHEDIQPLASLHLPNDPPAQLMLAFILDTTVAMRRNQFLSRHENILQAIREQQIHDLFSRIGGVDTSDLLALLFLEDLKWTGH